MTKFKDAQATATELTKLLYDRTPLEIATKKPLNENMDKIMERLWGKMMSLYGRQWESSYGHVDGETFREWTTALSSIRLENIGYAVEQLVEEGSDYPPNLIKFLRLCRKPVAPQMYDQFRPFVPMLPDEGAKTRRATAMQRHFERARELLGDWKKKTKEQEQ